MVSSTCQYPLPSVGLCRNRVAASGQRCHLHGGSVSRAYGDSARSLSSIGVPTAQPSLFDFDEYDETEGGNSSAHTDEMPTQVAHPEAPKGFGDIGDRMPRYAIFRGRKVRIVGYEDKAWEVIDTDDSRRIVHTPQLTFLKNKKS